MKKLFLLLSFVCITQVVLAQNPVIIGRSQFNAGLGMSSSGIPIYLGLDYGIYKDITLGGEFSYRSYRENWKQDYYNHSVIGLSGNGNYHFNRLLNIPANWDFYAGLNLGFSSWNSPNAYKGSHSSGLGLGMQVGGRYYFKDNMGINLEIGGGNVFSGGKIGISIKL